MGNMQRLAKSASRKAKINAISVALMLRIIQESQHVVSQASAGNDAAPMYQLNRQMPQDESKPTRRGESVPSQGHGDDSVADSARL
jgi:hypothetical protein